MRAYDAFGPEVVEVDVEDFERPRGLLPHPLAVYARQAEEAGHRLAAEEDVRAYVEGVGQREAAECSGVTVRVIIGAGLDDLLRLAA